MEEMDLLTTDQDETPADRPMITIIEGTEPIAQETIQESIVPPPGFLPFQWPQAEWEEKGEATLDPGLEFVASWSTRIMEQRSSTPPLIPLSPITAEDSQDSIVVQVGSPATEKSTPTGLDQIRSVHRRRSRRPMKGATKCEKPAPAEDFFFKNLLCAPAMGATRTLTEPRYHDGAWPGRDHSQMNDHKPPFGSWAKAAPSYIRPTVQRTTLLRRAGLVFR